ncbi:glycosyltransferase [Puniceicoccus vermicola]|uniref:Glycosyltransferase family 1 protein n=1 Tax=Puniceicoccus vermicola TaxID=388746 RepID=A0A7X1E371_9BACT|nr:glycosyltransferase family 1 protein [Puniceicoccus vermicola]
MKITLVTETFPPEINGVAMTLEKLALGLSRLGHQVSVIRPRQKEEPEPRPEFAEIPVAGIALPGYSELNMGLPVFHKIDELWRESRPDAVYLATEGPLGIAALLVALVRGILPVSGFHTNFHEYMRHYKLQWMEQIAEQYLRTVHNSTWRTFGPSRDLLGRLEEAGFRNLRLLERGVDTTLFTPERRSEELRKSWGAPPDSPVFLTVGRVASEKNMQLLFRAWEKIRTQRPDARLVIVGDGPERKALEKAWPDALFAGARRGDDLAAHYASADFFLFPSITETFGNVVTEALASGLVVLAFDYAAPGKFIQHEENGFIVPFKNEEAFLTVADCLTPSDQDWSAMREAARETGLQLSWEAVLERFVKDLREAIAQQKADGLQQI